MIRSGDCLTFITRSPANPLKEPDVSRAAALERVIGGTGQVAVKVFDGSRAGPADAPVTIDIRSERAFRYLATSSGQLGLARAYVMSDIEIEGDLYTALS